MTKWIKMRRDRIMSMLMVWHIVDIQRMGMREQEESRVTPCSLEGGSPFTLNRKT